MVTNTDALLKRINVIMRIKLILIFVFLFVSFPQSALTEGQFKIGLTLPLTGPFAEFGYAIQNAITLAKEKNPQQFEKVKIIFEDDQYSAKNTVAAFQKLKDVDKVDLAAVWGNEPALAVTPLAENLRFPLLAFGQAPAIAAGKKSVVRILGPANNFGTPIGEYLNSQKVENVKIILLENTFYKLVAESIRSVLTPTTSFKILASVPASENDFKPYLLKIKQSPNDFLGVMLAPAQLLSFFKQANELNIKNSIFGSTAFESEVVVKQARQLLNSSVYAHVEVNSEWYDQYLKRFGDDIQVSYAAVAFEVFSMIANFVNENPKISGQNLIEKIAKVSKQYSAAGEFEGKESEDQGRYLDFKVSLKKIVDGRVGIVDK
jgi:ABC-type branched-subunit amino acid transport system substrate-binding protein